MIDYNFSDLSQEKQPQYIMTFVNEWGKMPQKFIRFLLTALIFRINMCSNTTSKMVVNW